MSMFHVVYIYVLYRWKSFRVAAKLCRWVPRNVMKYEGNFTDPEDIFERMSMVSDNGHTLRFVSTFTEF